ncbi:CpsB/CapC family capsule biosynthesis tyrosine phosphatase [Algoriphagus sp. CAU 1675]|uniref:tyrosine-protein phosphatase n=1 Tax=Algoriphagus sp. CAU 1675 TaxID=3032597 RepID=UPI0023DC31AD|nr:CpsB/CapC family capsule biosynthesis tyrosine phosphatase [Algoriphagus sp. CAU 1675]MDF2156324.1 capsular biosynthesis protein [Algoriphagus sp. CAU 1675]
MGIFDFFKKKEQVKEPLDLSWMQVDMHSHLIPGIDDGSKSMEESIRLIKQLADFGLRKLITTPHIMSEFFRNTPEIIHMGLEDLKREVASEGIAMEIEAAAEYFMDEVLLEKVEAGEPLLTFGDQYILVETGFVNKPQMLFEVLFQLEMAGYKPILAHPERYQYLIFNKELLKDLIDRNILFQVNLLSFTGFYSREVKEFAEMLLKKGLIKFLGTDCHNDRYLEVLGTLPQTKYYRQLQEANWKNTDL